MVVRILSRHRILDANGHFFAHFVFCNRAIILAILMQYKEGDDDDDEKINFGSGSIFSSQRKPCR